MITFSFSSLNQKKNIFFRAHSKLIDESCSIFLQQFETNNPKTNNYGTLIEVFIRLATAVRDDCDEYVIQKNNELFYK
jgi:hypothetical protein